MSSEEKNAQIRGLIIGIAIGVVSVGLILAVVFATNYFINKKADQTNLIGSSEIKKIGEINGKIDRYFYTYSDEVGTDDIAEGAFRGIVEALNDPYSEYYSSEELEALMNDSEGISYGIGCVVSWDTEYDLPIIVSVVEESPAQEAGLMPGDVICKVDDEDVTGKTLTYVVNKIKGLDGTVVHISVYREGETDFIELDITRGNVIEDTTVTYGTLEENDKIGYIRIKEFSDVTVDQYIEGMAELNADNIEGLIIDLRNNPGGNLSAVVDIARRILPEGIIVYTEDKNGNRKDYTCDGQNEIDIPVVVLINQYSASASEILAGAIRDYHKGTLLGTTSFGKGIVQNLYKLSDGSAIKLTISAYFTPSGQNIQGVGIEPDVAVEYDYDAALNEGIDNQIQEATKILTKEIG